MLIVLKRYKKKSVLKTFRSNSKRKIFKGIRFIEKPHWLIFIYLLDVTRTRRAKGKFNPIKHGKYKSVTYRQGLLRSKPVNLPHWER